MVLAVIVSTTIWEAVICLIDADLNCKADVPKSNTSVTEGAKPPLIVIALAPVSLAIWFILA